jgi:hypothetical protein
MVIPLGYHAEVRFILRVSLPGGVLRTPPNTAGKPPMNASPPHSRPAAPPRRPYLTLLGWAFALFSSARILGYLPTLWAIHLQGGSSQHSLFTWITWLGANATMAAWLFEENGQRLSKPVVVNGCNAAMCLLVTLAILVYR